MILKEEDLLKGYNIGLSGAVPVRSTWSEPALDRAILEFISGFSALVFRYGGRIVHGCHPSFTPVIVRQAMRNSCQQKPITLVISELWIDSLKNHNATNYLKNAEIIVTRRAGTGGPHIIGTRNASLTLMRRHLLQRMNTLVAIGGELHEKDGIKPGVLEEVAYASYRGMPYFIIGGMGGMAGNLPQKLLLNSRNELTHEQNAYLMRSNDVSSCVGLIINHLSKNHELIERKLSHIDINDEDCVDYETYLKSINS
jgi:hypothetical protein